MERVSSPQAQSVSDLAVKEKGKPVEPMSKFVATIFIVSNSK